MKEKRKKRFWKKAVSFVLASVLGISGIGIAPVGNMEAKAADVIPISSAEDLQKIGNDSAYPLTGDYRLTQDIDLSGVDFTPIGGGMGARGSCTGDNVFKGTFDGAGHIISNLTIDKKENSSREWQYGLFGMIGSDNAEDKASVRNLILTGINIDVDMTADKNEAYLSLGGLAGEVNNNAEIDNIAIIGGTIQGNSSNQGDVVGAGGLIGEMRPENVSSANNGVTISNIYVGCDIVCGSSSFQNYAGGIIGRVAKASPASVTACVFTGVVSYKGDGGYGISGGDVTGNFSSCYYRFGLSNTGKQVTTAQLQAADLLEGLDSSKWTASAGNDMMLTQCVNAEGLGETLALAGLSLNLAQGDTFSSVTQNFTVPMSIQVGTKTEALNWASSNETVMQVNGSDGTVQVTPQINAVSVTLTASTKSGKTKKFQLTVKSDVTLKFDQEYAKVGEAVTASLTAAPQGTTCTYVWSVDGVSKGTDDSYTPTKEDLEKMLSVTARLTDSSGKDLGECGPVQMFISKLPVVYINTDDGSSIDSKTDYEGAQMRIQGNDRFQSTAVSLYDGAIEIRGRGNSTWNQALWSGGKRPYKIKLGKKTNLMGFGESKHWALLANYMDESLLRNKTSYDLAGEMGIQPSLPSTHVELILNGEYAGNYQLVGNVRIQESRVNIYNWEDLAEDAAKAIAKAEKANGQTVDQDALEDYMNQNMQWITSGKVSFKGKTYTISDYAVDIPQNSSGGVDVSGGFLFELDGYYDEVSKFRTNTNQPIMFKSPEFIRPTTGAGEGSMEKEDSSKQKCDALYNYAHEYIQTVEDIVHAPDYSIDIEETKRSDNVSNFTTDFKGRQHYTDLVDMDSLVKYLLLNEFYWNTETMKKSTFMYKDLGKKLMIGPVWDMDWTSNSIVSKNETAHYDTWMVVTRQDGMLKEQKESWYRYLIGDPYFVEKLYECYWDYREKFEDIAKDGGIIDQERAYLEESGESNYNLKGSLHQNCAYEEDSFDAGVTRLQTFLQNRLTWLDQQFDWSENQTPNAELSKATVDGLLSSFRKYQDTSAGKLSVSVDTETSASETTYTANVTDASIKKIGFYINGHLAGTQNVENGKAVLTINDGTAGLEKNAEKKAYVNNVVQAMAMDEAGNLMTVKGTYNDKEMDFSISDYTLFQKTIAAEPLTGTVEIQGLARVGCELRAVVSNSNNSGKFSYQWKADDVPIERATQESYVLTDAEEGKVITVEVKSSWETGSIVPDSGTDPVIKVVVENDHIIINQVYGGGANEDSAISHSFIELYNPTDQDISLAGYTLFYYSQGKNGATGAEGTVLNLESKTIPAKHSYLIRCEAQTIVTPDYTFYLTIADDAYDQEWTQTIDNKRFKILLKDGNGQIADGVSVNEGNIEEEGEQIPDGVISKQKSIRRKDFVDTNNNKVDFEQIDYRDADVKANRPRCLADGAWEVEEPAPEPTELKGTVSIRGNAVTGAILYADVTEAKDSYIGDVVCKWKADGSVIPNAAGKFLPTDASYEGKKISVEVTSANTEIKGTLSTEMKSAMQVVEAQREHVIINQVYGDGGKTGVPLSHSFIELYNPSGEAVDLTGYRIVYQSGNVTEELSLSQTIPSRTSYLIRGNASKSGDAAPVQVAEGDAVWELTIDNKQYCVLLKNGDALVDGVSVNEASVEGTPLTDPDPANDDTIISKKKAIRRIGFVDTDENASDFETLNYTNLNEFGLTEILASVQPRSTADGAWGLAKEEDKDDKNEPDEETLKAAEAAKEAAEAVEAIKSQYTKDSYEKLQTAYTALLRALESNDADQIKQATKELNQMLGALEKADDPGSNNKGKSLVGTQFTYKKGCYVITKDSGTEYTVTYQKPEKKTLKNVKVPAEVSYNNVSYKVTAIEAKAFAKNKKLRSVTIGKYVEEIGASAFAGDGKLKKITVQTTVLKKVGKKALKGIAANCKIKVPKKQLAAYKKKFKKKGQKSSVRIVK